VQKMRASIQIMGPLVARFGHARVAMPGGCNLGPRKIDIHLRGLAAMGGEVHSDHGFVEVTADRLKAVDLILDYPSVGATENLLMAGVMAQGTTTLENAAREPEIVDLCKFLVSMGADITGAGSSTVRINGVESMRPAEHTVIGDRIEAGTFLIMSAVTGGDVEVNGISPHVLDLFLSKLRAVGVQVQENTRSIRATGDPERYTAVDVATLPYPGFPTDLQAQMMVLLSVSKGVAVLTENVFENRFGFVDELIRLGADIRVDGNHAVISGGRALTGAEFDAAGRLTNTKSAVGEIVNRSGSGRFEGYYNDPDATAERLRNGWYWTGDLAYRDIDGWYNYSNESLGFSVRCLQN